MTIATGRMQRRTTRPTGLRWKRGSTPSASQEWPSAQKGGASSATRLTMYPSYAQSSPGNQQRGRWPAQVAPHSSELTPLSPSVRNTTGSGGTVVLAVPASTSMYAVAAGALTRSQSTTSPPRPLLPEPAYSKALSQTSRLHAYISLNCITYTMEHFVIILTP